MFIDWLSKPQAGMPVPATASRPNPPRKHQYGTERSNCLPLHGAVARPALNDGLEPLPLVARLHCRDESGFRGAAGASAGSFVE